MELYTLEEITAEIIGVKGSAERDEFDAEVSAAVASQSPQ